MPASCSKGRELRTRIQEKCFRLRFCIRRHRLALLPSLFTLSILATAIGCGDGRPGRVPVSGTVLIDGEPLTAGYIRFVPPNDRPSAGTIASDGRFTLGCFEDADGAVLGKHRVAVIANEVKDEVSMTWHAPQHYADYTTSGLEIEITGPTDDLRIELSSESPTTP